MTRVRLIFTAGFWLDASERAIKAAAGGMLTALLTPKAADVVGVTTSIPWQTAGVAGVLAGLISYLGSIASAPVGDTISPASTVKN